MEKEGRILNLGLCKRPLYLTFSTYITKFEFLVLYFLGKLLENQGLFFFFFSLSGTIFFSLDPIIKSISFSVGTKLCVQFDPDPKARCFSFQTDRSFFGEAELEVNKSTMTCFLCKNMILDEGYWLAIFFFFTEKNGQQKGPCLFKKRVGQHNHLPTWSSLKTEFEECFPDVGDVFSPPQMIFTCRASLSKFKKFALVSGMGKQEMLIEIRQ